LGDEHIIAANYMMQRLDIKGRLYSGFNTYETLPSDTERNVNYTDTADEGEDFLCSIMAKIKGQYWYVTDVLYTQDPQEVTEDETADMLIVNDTKIAFIESNNGGRAFARNVQRLLKEKNSRCNVSWFHQGKNKKARILTQAATAQKYILFPEDWKSKWPQFYTALMTYQKEGKNKHDDAPDTITGLIEKTGRGSMPQISATLNR
jgi:predicted phage terminase large subunit-like protein